MAGVFQVGAPSRCVPKSGVRQQLRPQGLGPESERIGAGTRNSTRDPKPKLFRVSNPSDLLVTTSKALVSTSFLLLVGLD